MAHQLQYSGAMLTPLSGSLERYLDFLSARQKLVASNLANLDTPGFRTRDLDPPPSFDSVLEVAPRVAEVRGLATKNDGNNVSLDRETALLAENTLRFNIASNLLKSQIRAIRGAIQEGK